MTVTFEDIHEGDTLPALQVGPITRLDLALYAGASGDHNPIHVDIDFARQAGMDDVFAHGMLGMAYLGRVLTNWVPQTALRSFSVRFAAMTHVGDRLTATARVVETNAEDRTVRLALSLDDERGETKLLGDAVCAL